jgi:hypothetical protein
MKKYILILLTILSVNTMAQITLKDDSITFKNEIPSNGTLDSKKFKDLNGFSKYSGTIQGFSGYCNFPIENQKIFYDNFMKKIISLNLSSEEFEIINNSFKQSAYEIKKNGINGLTCEKFKEDFDKIIKYIKSQN